MGHAVGLVHEFQRPDAEDYVQEKCLKGLSSFGIPVGDFDEDSIMHHLNTKLKSENKQEL